MEKKTFWRCTVCGDLHYGIRPPETCPTCGSAGTLTLEIERAIFLKTFEE